MSFRRRAAAAALALVLPAAACQPLPHPFADDRPAPGSPILTVPDVVGIVVEPVEGAPEATGAALASAMATSLQGIEVPATTGPGNPYAYRLTGTATAVPAGETTSLTIDWLLRSAAGAEVGRDRQVASLPTGQWQGGAVPAAFAAAEAPRIGRFIQEPALVEHETVRQLFIRSVDGAPGDGRQALPGALAYVLKRRGIPVTPDSWTADALTIAGTVTVVPGGKPNQDHVKIVWHVLKPDGTDVGQVTQENDVPHGTLDGRWGEVAMAVAMAGVDDILRVVKTVPPAA